MVPSPLNLMLSCALLAMLGGCDEEPASPPLPPFDNTAACAADGGLPRCRERETFVCGTFQGQPWLDSLYIGTQDAVLLPRQGEGKLVSIPTGDFTTDFVSWDSIQLLILPDGRAWCLEYESHEVGWVLGPLQVFSECQDTLPASRVFVEDNHIAFTLNRLSNVPLIGDSQACETEPTDAALKGCSGLRGIGRLLR